MGVGADIDDMLLLVEFGRIADEGTARPDKRGRRARQTSQVIVLPAPVVVELMNLGVQADEIDVLLPVVVRGIAIEAEHPLADLAPP